MRTKDFLVDVTVDVDIAMVVVDSNLLATHKTLKMHFLFFLHEKDVNKK